MTESKDSVRVSSQYECQKITEKAHKSLRLYQKQLRVRLLRRKIIFFLLWLCLMFMSRGYVPLNIEITPYSVHKLTLYAKDGSRKSLDTLDILAVPVWARATTWRERPLLPCNFPFCEPASQKVPQNQLR